MIGQMRHSGVGLLGELPWGTHVCQFYQTQQDLLEVLGGYFRQGLKDNEFCLWVTSQIPATDEAHRTLAVVVPNLGDYIRRGQMEIVAYRDWYSPDGRFDADRVLNNWLEKERAAVARGYEGLRAASTLSWLKKENWKAFANYEAAFNTVIVSQCLMALCSYSVDQFKGVEILDVLRNHPVALVRRENSWEVVRSPQQQKTEEMLHKSEQREKAILGTIPYPAWLKDREGRFLDVNEAWRRFFGLDAKEVLGKTGFEFLPQEIAARFAEQDRNVVESQRPFQDEELLTDTNGRKVWFETVKSPLFDEHREVVGISGIAHDISEQKRAERERRIAIEFLHLINVSNGTHQLIQMATGFLQEQSGCEAVGVRLREGDDCPYYETHDVPQEFVLAENSLCTL